MELWSWIVLGILSVLTVLGNGAVIILITTRRRLRKSPNLFVLSLAVADFIFGALFLPLLKLYEVYMANRSSRTICFLVVITLGAASVTNLCVMTLDRYIAIVHPLRYVSFMKPRRVGALISAAWLMALIRPSLYSAQLRPADALTKLDSVLYHLIPCIALLLATGRILLIVRRHSKRTASLLTQLRHNYPLRSPQARTAARRQTAPTQLQEAISARVLLAVVVVFVLCYAMGASNTMFIPEKHSPRLLGDLFHILVIVNSAVNPFAYAFFKTDIKREMRICFSCLKNSHKPPF